MVTTANFLARIEDRTLDARKADWILVAALFSAVADLVEAAMLSSIPPSKTSARLVLGFTDSTSGMPHLKSKTCKSQKKNFRIY